jgi:hypothetical protein
VVQSSEKITMLTKPLTKAGKAKAQTSPEQPQATLQTGPTPEPAAPATEPAQATPQPQASQPSQSQPVSQPPSEGSGVASPAQNSTLEHSQGGVTTRDDKTDLGVPMLPGAPNEKQGPEDALGPGLKRGDYSQRLGGSAYNPHESAIPQQPRVVEIGDEAGKKGGVETS